MICCSIALNRKDFILPGQTGLRNLGNTCYMNSVLQALASSRPFRDYFLSLISEKSVRINGREVSRRDTISCLISLTHETPSKLMRERVLLSREMHNLMRVLWSGKWAVVTPYGFLAAVWKCLPDFRNHRQHDSQEFLVALLNSLDEELSSVRVVGQEQLVGGIDQKSERSFVPNLFLGVFQNNVLCLSCKQVSTSCQLFTDISLGIPEKFAQPFTRRKVGPVECPLESCLESFFAEDFLGCVYNCSSCNKVTNGSQQYVVKSYPQILVLVIKRFIWLKGRPVKLQTIVTTPLQLDLSKFSTGCHCEKEKKLGEGQDTMYDLSAIVLHSGSRLTSGHYTTLCYNKETGTWLHFNDGKVDVVSSNHLLLEEPYMLFYVRSEGNITSDIMTIPASVNTIRGPLVFDDTVDVRW
eukprot:TRINITY_DN10296_c0_g1_i1.p1 TRINITY_DN10296_c0_g1~~TRINITY_DN10296_c0_g1_i1.p1  ORF type:complete len:411 (-),score=57.92 TRINITY_DN10296_c0_g1_i1:211-1443(-)